MFWKYLIEQRKRLITIGARICFSILCLLIIMQSGSSLLSSVYGSNNEKLKTYIVYDDITRFGDNYPFVTVLVEYLGHFELSFQEMPVVKWSPGSMKDADLIVYAGLNKQDIPKELLEEMARAKRIIWFERNIEQMAEHLKWKDFQLDGISSGWLYLNYKKDMLFSEWTNIVVAQPGQQANVLASVKNITGSKPLAWQRDNVYYCGALNFDQYFAYTLADLLHQFIPNNHPRSSSAFLRVEDVSPLVSPKAVKEVLDTINRYRIPFAIGVIPVGVAADGTHIYLHERTELVKILQEAQHNGASIILHGYSHQNIYSPKTGEGYEFWNARDDKPMENDEEFTEKRLEAGISELVRCGLTPLAFEPPHYAMSKTGYNVLSRHFNIFSGEIQVSDKSAKITATLPYISQSAYLNGMLAIPENMGYYDGKTFLVENMLQNSERILDVQDGLACFFYHGYLAPDKLGPIIEAVQKQGYEFLDLRRFQIKVQSSQIKITGGGGYIDVTIDEQLKASWKDNPLKTNLWDQVGTVHVAVLVLIIVFFIFIIIRLRFNANKYYER